MRRYGYLGREHTVVDWHLVDSADWVLLDSRSGELLGASPGSVAHFALSGSWEALTGGRLGARLFKFVVEETRGSADTGTTGGRLSMSELSLQQCPDFDEYAADATSKAALALEL